MNQLAHGPVENAGLKWTGHPLVDVGVATLCAMADKTEPEQLTLTDLDAAADEMTDYYSSGVMASYTQNVFTINAYDNPKSALWTKRAYVDRVLKGHRWAGDVGAAQYTCVFSGQTATHLVERRQMPMLTGENVINFYPGGQGALPVAGAYVVALQALPLGGRLVEGKLLIAHADLPEVTLAFSRKYLARNRRLIGLAKANALPRKAGPTEELEREQAAGWDERRQRPKYPDAKAATSLVSSDLLEIWSERQDPLFNDYPVSITVYWFSNGKRPSLKSFHLPAQVVRFLNQVSQPPCGDNWRRITARGWQRPMGNEVDKENAPEVPGKGKRRKEFTKPVAGGPGRSRNVVLTDLLSIYEHGFIDLQAATRFLRRHLLQQNSSIRGKSAGATTETEDFKAVDWAISVLFMKEVMGMDERYAQRIRDFADKLAQYIEGRNDQQLFRNVVYCERPWQLRNALAKAQRNEARERNQLLFSLDDYLGVFEADDAVGRGDWSLVRDLVSIRLVEQLFNKGFFQKEENRDLLESQTDEED